MPALDHLIFLTTDLETAARSATDIGFTMEPIGRHPKLGTCNRLAMLDHTYLELLAVEEMNERTALYSDWLERETGIVGLALAGSAADEFHRLSSQGYRIDPPVSFGRPVVVDGREEAARFSIARIAHDQTPGAFAFVCEHHTPELVWSGHVRHGNGSSDVAVLRWLCRDREATATAYAQLAGTGIERSPDALIVGLDNVRLEFVKHNPLGDLSLGDHIADGMEARMISVEFAGGATSEWRTWPDMGIAYRVCSKA